MGGLARRRVMKAIMAHRIMASWLAGRLPVLDGRVGDDHIQDQPGHVDGDVPFAAVDLLDVVPATGSARSSVSGADGLGVDDRGGELGVPPGGGPDQGAQLIVQLGQGAARRRSTRRRSARAGSHRTGGAGPGAGHRYTAGQHRGAAR
jgi:hypothetical protein